MEGIRRAAASVLWALQWSLAFTLFVLGLLETGLRPEDLGPEGLIQALAAMALVIPSATGFWPRLSPIVAAFLASTIVYGTVEPFAAVGVASPLADLALAAACAAVAVGRGFLLPVSPIDLGPDAVDPFALPPELVARALQARSSLGPQRGGGRTREAWRPAPDGFRPEIPSG